MNTLCGNGIREAWLHGGEVGGGDGSPDELGEGRGGRGAVGHGAPVGRAGGREDDPVAVAQSGSDEPTVQQAGEPGVRAERRCDHRVRSPRRDVGQVDEDVVAGRQQQGHEPGVAIGRQGVEHRGGVGLLHVDEGAVDLEVGSGGGDGGDEPGDGCLTVGRGGAVRAGDEGRGVGSHGPTLAPGSLGRWGRPTAQRHRGRVSGA